MLFAGLYQLVPNVLDALKIVKPETVIRWLSLPRSLRCARAAIGHAVAAAPLSSVMNSRRFH